jgi:tetratricopeptide (TPR) repeat protein
MRNSMQPSSMRVFKRFGGFGLFAIFAFLNGCDRGTSTRSLQHVELEHFDGAIDNSDSTYDIAKSNLYVRASELLEEGDVDAAKVLYRKAIEQYPNDPDGYAALGASLYFEHKYDDATAQYLRARELDALCVSAHYGLGCVAYARKQYADAIEHLTRALDVTENDQDCHRVLGMVFHAVGDTPKAISHYERALALNPRDDSTRETLRQIKQQSTNRRTNP